MCCSSPNFSPSNIVRINLLGDSIVAEEKSHESDTNGWGFFLAENFTNVSIRNFALSGRSTKTFLLEQNWSELQVTHADIWLIQFGHNDSHSPDKFEHTAADGAFKENLETMIVACRRANALPILITPPHRGKFEDGNVSSELLPYVRSIKEVADRSNLSVIDLYSWTGEWFEKLGPLRITEPFTPKDQTHFNPNSAKKIAGEIAIQLAALQPSLKLRR